MRVVAGVARGRQLRAPVGSATRPTSDRVREAMFSMMGSLGAVEGATVVDLFAGSGALGIEALSRGAAAATFVDSDRAAVDCIRANLEVLGPSGPTATVVRADVLGWVAGAPAFDLALADPPYRWDGWPALLEGLAGRAALLVAEMSADDAARWDGGPRWETVKEKRYGGTVVAVAKPQ
jgi:16S rRNA (guanine966-N2)-methyltransferase